MFLAEILKFMEEYKKSWTEEIQVKSSERVAKIKKRIKQGNIRKLILLKENGDVLAPVAPVFAAIGAMAALLTKVRVQIIQNKDGDGKPDEE